MKNLLITGGTGFIGSHTCISFLENGYSLFVIDSALNSKPEIINSIIKILDNKISKLEEKFFYPNIH